jgi:tRNA threonylcarbamoyladenosine biosynthesis protein TsaB
MKKIMAIETSSALGTVAVAIDDNLLLERPFTAGLRHAGELLPTMRDLCREVGWQPGDIDELYVSVGPGSFTGVRISVTAAKTMAFALGTKIVAVPSTDALVLNSEEAGQKNYGTGQMAVVLEAKRAMIYAAVYKKVKREEKFLENDKKKPVTSFVPDFDVVIEPCVTTAKELLEQTDRPLVMLGDGLKYQGEKLLTDGVLGLDEQYWQPRAANVLRCGRLRSSAGLYTEPDRLVPIYLRRPEAVERWEKLHPDDH